MKTPFCQPLIPVVLSALVERHPAFGNVCYKNSPAGEQSESLSPLKVVSFAVVDRRAGLIGACLAIRYEQEIGLSDGGDHTPPRRQITGIIGPVSSESFTQNRNPGRIQGCQALFELQKIRPVIFAVAKFQNTVFPFLRMKILSIICWTPIFFRIAMMSGIVSTLSIFWATINLKVMGFMMTMTSPV
jgi:hypothetical protein